MKIVFVSDTHNYLRQMTLPPGDVIIHAGDATMGGKLDEVAHFAKTYGELPYKHRILIAGNHDWMAQRDNALWRTLMKERGITYLEDSGAVIDPDGHVYPWDPEKVMAGIKVWGSPWQPWFYDWAFNLKRGSEIKAKWNLIPAGVDILVTHGPPYGKLDLTLSYNGNPREEVGCYDLADAITRVKPRVHAFGHIHCGYGVVQEDGTTYVNASNCDEHYDACQDPIVLEITDEKVEIVHVGSRSNPAPQGRGLWL
jgi:predicted phosphodiesterase